MNSTTRGRLANAAIAVVFLFAIAPLAACSSEPVPAGNSTVAPTNTQPTAPAVNTAPVPPGPADAKPPLGMEDTIEGRVIGLYCYKQNPKASIEELTACAKANVDKGGVLGLLGSDGTIYVDEHPDAGVTNRKLSDFIGEEVTIQGQMIGDAPQLNFGDVKVKKFNMKLVRRKGSAPADVKKGAAPAKKP